MRRLGVVRFGSPVRYAPAMEVQEKLAACVNKGLVPSLVMSLVHQPCFTLGRRGKEEDLLTAEEERKNVDVVRTTRGGEVTYHGPGQLVVYPILKLRTWELGARRYVEMLEDAVVNTLGRYGIEGRGRVAGATGVWVGDRKIAAIGVKISRGVATHGLALNVDPDLDRFKEIVPCGLKDKEVTSMSKELDADGEGGVPDLMEVQGHLLKQVGSLVGVQEFSLLTGEEMEVIHRKTEGKLAANFADLQVGADQNWTC
ncbi:lipoate protein ligase [Chloropicon primus]|uniref:lipoyl(octanoyl) transferase n=2 Tax=Chloropicon primus TaxID=1764295 RepID=A0A5B8MDJ1_9CHLO|nr:lipoate protein ligase [Chloropicon primus]UPQ97688.1 lipoate protein ligase [Chloropicon primus]|eukprot:QDZ18479.1 lipoate protein ligase [Chloropicon primus]